MSKKLSVQLQNVLHCNNNNDNKRTAKIIATVNRVT